MSLTYATKGEVRKRLKASGRWVDFVQFREHLKLDLGYPPEVAWEIALERFFPGEYGHGHYVRPRNPSAAREPYDPASAVPPLEEEKVVVEEVLGPEPEEEEPLVVGDWGADAWREALIWTFLHLHKKRRPKAPNALAEAVWKSYGNGRTQTEKDAKERELREILGRVGFKRNRSEAVEEPQETKVDGLLGKLLDEALSEST